MKRDKIGICLIEVALIVLIIAGGIVFTNGFKTENPMNMVGGLGLMMCAWIQFYLIFGLETVQALKEEIDDLKTDQAILQNRCDWIEDDICKEYKEE